MRKKEKNESSEFDCSRQQSIAIEKKATAPQRPPVSFSRSERKRMETILEMPRFSIVTP